MTIDNTLETRSVSHGSFYDNSRLSQTMKSEVRDAAISADVHLTSLQLEALDMIVHKIARICCGDPTFADHWHDIAGYATLVEKTL